MLDYIRDSTEIFDKRAEAGEPLAITWHSDGVIQWVPSLYRISFDNKIHVTESCRGAKMFMGPKACPTYIATFRTLRGAQLAVEDLIKRCGTSLYAAELVELTKWHEVRDATNAMIEIAEAKSGSGSAQSEFDKGYEKCLKEIIEMIPPECPPEKTPKSMELSPRRDGLKPTFYDMMDWLRQPNAEEVLRKYRNDPLFKTSADYMVRVLYTPESFFPGTVTCEIDLLRRNQ
jgi:hypothetical protein